MTTREALEYVANNAGEYVNRLHPNDVETLRTITKLIRDELRKPWDTSTGYRLESLKADVITALNGIEAVCAARAFVWDVSLVTIKPLIVVMWS